MNVLDELKDISDNAIAALSARFPDLPRPLLAAIGAGDLAVERLAHLREQVSGKVGDAMPDGIGSMPSGDDLKAMAADLPGKAQKIAGDIAAHVSEFAAEAPAKAQRLINELPGKAQEFGSALSPDRLKETLEGYTHFVGMIYGNLADRGGETVAKVRSDDDAPAAKKAAPKKATATKAGTTKPAAKKATATKAAPTKAGTTKPTAKKPAAKKEAPKKAAPTTTAAKPSADDAARTDGPAAGDA